MYKEEKLNNNNNSVLNGNEHLDDFYDANNNNNYKKFANYKLNNTFSNNNSRLQFSRDSYDYENNLDQIEKPSDTLVQNNNFKFTPSNSIRSNNSFKDVSPQNKKLANSLNILALNQEDKYFNTSSQNTNHNSTNSYRKTFDSNTNSFEKDSVATASDSVSINSQDNIENNANQYNTNNKNLNNNNNNINNSNNNNYFNRQYKPNQNNKNNTNNTNNILQNTKQIQAPNATKNSKFALKVEEKVIKPNLKEEIKPLPNIKLKEVANTLVKEKQQPQQQQQMKSRNNQSTFAKNPTQSYAEPYYASFPPNARPPKMPVSYFDFTAQFSPREVIYPYIVPTNLGPLAPIIPAAFPYHSPTGLFSYNMWMRPLILDDKNPSIHDLLYYETFQRNKDGNLNNVNYATKHIEKKIRAVDGFYNPYGRYTLQDYRNLKANELFASNPSEIDPETKDDKAEKMHKRQEVGNLFMKSNPKPARKPINLVEPAESLPLPPPQRKQVNLQEPFDLKNPKIKLDNNNDNHNNNDQIFNPRNNFTQSLDFDDRYFDQNNAKNYNPNFYNNSLNAFPSNANNNANNNADWIDLEETIKDDAKLSQSQKLQVNHPTKKFYKNPKFNFTEKPVEVPVVEKRARAMEYAKRIKE